MDIEQPKIDQENLEEEIKFKLEMIQTRIKQLSDAVERLSDPTLVAEHQRFILDANLEVSRLQKLLPNLLEDIKKREL